MAESKLPALLRLSKARKEVLKSQITIRIEPGIIKYFKDLADKSGIPYQSLINLCLKECAKDRRFLKWVS